MRIISYELLVTSCYATVQSEYSVQSEHMGWLRLVGSLKLYVSFAKEPYKGDYILQKRPIILRSLLIVATLFQSEYVYKVDIVYKLNIVRTLGTHKLPGVVRRGFPLVV